jgi:hypothetical protein
MLRIKLFLIIIISFSYLNGYSQFIYKNGITANNHSSFDRITSISPTLNNGTISSLGSYNASFICNDENGDSLWTLELPSWSRGIASFQLADSNFILLSLFNDSLLTMVKTDSDGNPVWTKYLKMQLGNVSFGSLFGYNRLSDTALVVDFENTFYLISTSGFLYKKIQVNIFNQVSYPPLWMHPDVVRCYIFDNDKIYIAGTIADTSNSKAYAMCIDTSGNLIWDRIIYTSSPIGINSIFKDHSGNILLGGRLVYFNGPIIWQQTIVIKLDANGNYLWAKWYNHDIASEIRSISNGIRTDYAIMEDAGFIFETDSNGTVIYKKKLNGAFIFPANTFVTTDHYFITSDISRLYKTDTLIQFGCGEDSSYANSTLDYVLNDTTGVLYSFGTDSTVEVFRDTLLSYSRGFQYDKLCSIINGIDNNKSADIRLFPNPTTGHFKISFPEQLPFTDIIIMNSFGQEVNRVKYTKPFNLEIEIKGESGLYFVRVLVGEKSRVFKVLKM